MADEDRERWDRKWTDRGAPREPAERLVSRAGYLPTSGRALDLAGGNGRHALWLARRGLAVTLVDVSPVGLEVAAAVAREEGLALEVARRNLDTEDLPEGPFEAVVIHHFVSARAYAQVPSRLAPGGVLLAVHFTVRNLERHDTPSRRYLLEEGALRGMFPGLEVVRYEEGWGAAGFHEACLVARRPAG